MATCACVISEGCSAVFVCGGQIAAFSITTWWGQRNQHMLHAENTARSSKSLFMSKHRHCSLGENIVIFLIALIE